jgi:hypothetical protein
MPAHQPNGRVGAWKNGQVALFAMCEVRGVSPRSGRKTLARGVSYRTRVQLRANQPRQGRKMEGARG